MLKLVGAVLIIFASAGLGYLKSRELMLHEKNLEEFFTGHFMPERRDTVRKQLGFRMRFAIRHVDVGEGTRSFRKGGCMHRS